MPDVKVPSVERLDELLETLSIIGAQYPDAPDIITALTWLRNHLADRKHYHKRHQLKKRLIVQIAKRMLGEEDMRTIDQEVERQSFEQVANEPPDPEEIKELTSGATH